MFAVVTGDAISQSLMPSASDAETTFSPSTIISMVPCPFMICPSRLTLAKKLSSKVNVEEADPD